MSIYNGMRKQIAGMMFFALCFCGMSASRGAAFCHHPQRTLRHQKHIPSLFASNVNGEGDEEFMSQNKLLHCMLRVPHVNATLDFWKEQGANVYSYRKTSKKAETAFCGFGARQKDCFSLEITKTQDDFVLGNAISYLGISMLHKMKNLETAAAGEKSGLNVTRDFNGIELRPVASAPGDAFARICFHVNADMFAQTTSFYQQLGMELVAADEQVLCLRFNNQNDLGVATTLVFSKFSQELQMGNCYDHLAISTTSVQAAAMALRKSLDDPDKTIFMDPCLMFGTQIMGLVDPSGYKVYLVEQQS